jgi:hypothetical protein
VNAGATEDLRAATTAGVRRAKVEDNILVCEPQVDRVCRFCLCADAMSSEPRVSRNFDSFDYNSTYLRINANFDDQISFRRTALHHLLNVNTVSCWYFMLALPPL